jgi:hypothetical protein
MTEKISESEQRAAAYSATLLATDPRFNQAALVLHEDGSLFRIQCAFLMVDPQNPQWLWLITEHFGELVFDKDDIERTEEMSSVLSLRELRL